MRAAEMSTDRAVEGVLRCIEQTRPGQSLTLYVEPREVFLCVLQAHHAQWSERRPPRA